MIIGIKEFYLAILNIPQIWMIQETIIVPVAINTNFITVQVAFMCSSIK